MLPVGNELILLAITKKSLWKIKLIFKTNQKSCSASKIKLKAVFTITEEFDFPITMLSWRCVVPLNESCFTARLSATDFDSTG